MARIENIVAELEMAGWEVVSDDGDEAELVLETPGGNCTIEISEDRNGVRLDLIRAETPGRGAGTEGLTSLVEAASQVGVDLVLDVRPQPGCLMDEIELASWYERSGAGDAPAAGHFGMAFHADGPGMSF